MADTVRLRVARIAAYSYRLPLRDVFTTGHGTLSWREGFLIKVVDADGVVGWGEAAPLAQFGGDRDATGRAITTIVEGARATGSIGGRPHPDPLPEGEGTFTQEVSASTDAFTATSAFETAVLDIVARRSGLSITDHLQPAAPSKWGGGILPSIAVNAVIGGNSIEESVSAARAAVAAGYRALKIKVGIMPLAEDVTRVAAIRDAIGPETELRLDANGAFNESEARRFIDGVVQYRIAYFEQPTLPDDLGALARLSGSGVIAIAADESASTQASASRVARERLANVLVLKPMLLGGIEATKQIADVARANGISVTVTTTIDTGIGTAMALHCAAVVAPDLVHGLATASLLADDLTGGAPAVSDGAIALPGPGLGVLPGIESAIVRGYVVPM